MSHLFQYLGFAGVAISCLAYLPQILHLAKEHCSAGVSVRAWIMWLAAALMIGSHAASKADTVFIALQIVNAGAAGMIVVLARRYCGMRCAAHQCWPGESEKPVPGEGSG